MQKIASSMLRWLLCLGLIFGAGLVHSQPGSLDPSFGTAGQVVTGFGQSIAPHDAALQADGKLVVVGLLYVYVIATQAFAVVRYLPDGSLDPDFGEGGLAVTAFTYFINSADAVSIQDDGRILVAGEAEDEDGSQFAIARYNTDGSLDSSFGTDGRVTTDFLAQHSPGFSQAADVVLLQPDGQILVGGVVRLPRTDFSALARYNPDGSLDPTFGDNGKVAVVAIDNVNALAVLADGQILALNRYGSIAQFDSDGSLVPITGGTIVATAHTGITAFQLDGNFLLAGTAPGPSGRRDIDVRAVRFQSTGGIDPTFRSPAFDFGDPGPFANIPQAVALQADGQVVIGGFSDLTTRSGRIFGLARLNADGSLDSSFANGGRLTTEFFAADQVFSVVVQPDGNIIAVGQTVNPGTFRSDLALARYLGQ